MPSVQGTPISLTQLATLLAANPAFLAIAQSSTVSISSAVVSSGGNLILTLSNGTSMNLGNVIGPTGAQGNQGNQGNAGPPVVQSLLGMLGGWNASTNVPALASNVGTANTGYYVTTAGTTTLNGISSWAVNDVAAFVGGAWIKLTGYAAAAAVASLTVTGSLSAGGLTISTGIFPYVWPDAQGYASVYIDNAGVFHSASSNIASLTAAQASVSSLTAGGLTISSGMFAYVWPDSQGFASLYVKNDGTTVAAKLQAAIFNNFTITSNPLFPFAVTDGGYMGFGIRYDGLLIGKGIDPANTPQVATYNFDATTHFQILKTVKRLKFFYWNGQSNNVAFNQTSDALLTPAPIYPNNAFMFNNCNGGSPHVTGVPATGLTPLYEVLTDTALQARETKASSTINNVLSMLAGVGDTGEYFLAAIGAISGTAIENLARGSAQGVNFIQACLDAKRLGAAAGFDEVILEAISMHQGEQNTAQVNGGTVSYGFEREAFASYHENNFWKACEDAKRIFRQSRDPILYVTIDGTVTASPFEQPIYQAWNDLRSRIPNMRIVGGSYHSQRWQPIATYGAGALHNSSLGQNRLGVDLARAYIQEEFGVGWSDMRITDVRWVAANQFIARIFCPLGGVPVLDTSESVVATVANVSTGALAITGYYGLMFDDASGSPPTITGSSIGTGSNANDVTFTLSAPPAGYGPCRLAGGTAYSVGATGLSGPLVGARTAFRSSVGTPSISESGAIQYPWLTPFVMSIARP